MPEGSLQTTAFGEYISIAEAWNRRARVATFERGDLEPISSTF